MKDERRGTLLGLFHILGLEINLIHVSKMSDVGVTTMFENDTCKMVQGTMVFMRGIKIKTI